MLIAACMEFAGSMAVGARVLETIRTKIINTKLFAQEPSVLILGMVCAVIGSSLYLTAATRLGLPVSTTHSILGGRYHESQLPGSLFNISTGIIVWELPPWVPTVLTGARRESPKSLLLGRLPLVCRCFWCHHIPYHQVRSHASQEPGQKGIYYRSDLLRHHLRPPYQ